MSDTIHVLSIPTSGSPAATDLHPDLDSLQTAIGGALEALTLDPDRGVTMFLDDEGKTKYLPVNELATLVAEQHHPGFVFRDVIVGDVIIAGRDSRGNTADVPSDIIDQVTTLEDHRRRTA